MFFAYEDKKGDSFKCFKSCVNRRCWPCWCYIYFRAINTSQSFLWKLSHAQGIGAVEAIEVPKGTSVSVKTYRTEGADKAVNTIRERAYQEIPDNLKDSFAIAKEDILVTLNADKTVQEQVLPDNTARDAVVHQLYYWLTPQNGNLWDPFIAKKVTVKPAKLVLNQKLKLRRC